MSKRKKLDWTAVAFIALGLMAIALFFQPIVNPSRQTSQSRVAQAQGHELVGVVTSSGAVNLGRLQGGTRELAMVRLPDGTIVSALVVHGGPLSAGDSVTLSSPAAPTIGMGLPPYEASARH